MACEEDTLTGTALLEVEPASLDFGPVAFGESRTLLLRLQNPSASAPLDLSSIAFAEGSAAVFELGEVPTELPPRGEVELEVRYVPDDALGDAATLVIRSNASIMPTRRVPVRSGRTHPRLAVRPAEVDLGSLLAGGRAEATLELLSVGDGPITVHRLALRTAGFAGEPCANDGQCREGTCLPSPAGRTCAPACDAGCPDGLVCGPSDAGAQACFPSGPRPLEGRGFSVDHPDLPDLPLIAPGATTPLAVVYAPAPEHRGSAQLWIESDDEDDPVIVVPLLGRPENLPPVAAAEFAAPPPNPVPPGTRISLTGMASADPEGSPLTYRWRFVARPQGSQARFEDPTAMDTAFTVDRPGPYIAGLEVLDDSGQASSNDARVEVEAVAGSRFDVELTWDRLEADLDLHVVAPGGSLGAITDCFFDNPAPDWQPPGPVGDPVFTSAPTSERIDVPEPHEGVFSIAVRVVAGSPAGATDATVRIRFDDTEVARYRATLEPSAEAWDVATLSWPAGRIADLDTVR